MKEEKVEEETSTKTSSKDTTKKKNYIWVYIIIGLLLLWLLFLAFGSQLTNNKKGTQDAGLGTMGLKGLFGGFIGEEEKELPPEYPTGIGQEGDNCDEDLDCDIGLICIDEICDLYSFTCNDNSGCGTELPICDTTVNDCVECTDDSHCGEGFSCEANICVDDGPEGCETDDDCGDENGVVCSQSCIQGECRENGKFVCDDGRCLDDASDCGCEPACDFCTESCTPIAGRPAECKETGQELCDNGECVSAEFLCESTSHQCDPVCNSCEFCAVEPDSNSDDGNRYVCRDANDPIDTVKVCDSGDCVPLGDTCPEDCGVPCDPCVGECVSGENGEPDSCRETGDHYCGEECFPGNVRCEDVLEETTTDLR